MKTTLTILAMSLSMAAISQTTNPAPYCATPNYNSVSTCKGAISNVSIGTMSNSTTLSNRYTYYDNIAAPVLLRGRSYTLSLTFDTIPTICRNDFSKYRVIVAYDNTENYFLSNRDSVYNGNVSTANIPVTKTVTINIPLTATIGIIRMRVIRYGNQSTGGMQITCGDGLGWYGIGEVEDYNLRISDLTTDIKNVSKSDFVFYPNPASDKLTMNSEMPTIVINLLGQQMDCNQSGNTIDISNLPNGMYILQNGIGLYRFVVSR